MSDYFDDDFIGNGLYRVWYGRSQRPAGPYETVRAMAVALRMTDYPDDGYVVDFADDVLSNVPSLNPDDLRPGWNHEDAHAAQLEGWDIFWTDSVDHDPYEIQFLQDPAAEEYLPYDEPKFEGDPDVWVHVRNLAWMGSELHQRALAFLKEHSPGEFERVRDYKPKLLAQFRKPDNRQENHQ